MADREGDGDGDEGAAVPVTPSTVKVHAQFVQVGERRVFVRHAGRGPALVVLHQSPQSSASMQPWFERFAATHAVFAPDTPGFGRSDPLPRAQPTVPDLAQALGELLQALGLQRVLLYGVHSGAAIAARLALDQPQRVAGLVCDGLSGFTTDERQPLLDGYLPPFEPSFDGGHLLWLWARVREQYLFFPWHHGSAAARILYPAMPAAALHADVMDLLDEGDGYRAGYRARPIAAAFGPSCALEVCDSAGPAPQSAATPATATTLRRIMVVSHALGWLPVRVGWWPPAAPGFGAHRRR